MERIWQPLERPPCLDKFCHLSVDAQKVMAALYTDFHQRRVQLRNQIKQTPGNLLKLYFKTNF